MSRAKRAKTPEAPRRNWNQRDPEGAFLRAVDNGVTFGIDTMKAAEVSTVLHCYRISEAREAVTIAETELAKAQRAGALADTLAAIGQFETDFADLDLGVDLVSEAEANVAAAKRKLTALTRADKAARKEWQLAMREEVDRLAKTYVQRVAFTLDPETTTISERVNLEAAANSLAPDLEVLYLVAIAGDSANPTELKALREAWKARPPQMPTLAEVQKQMRDAEYNAPHNVRAREEAAEAKARAEARTIEGGAAARYRHKSLAGKPDEETVKEAETVSK